MKYSKEKVDYIIQQYKLGLNQKQIADKLNTYNTTIRRILMQNGIPLISSQERWRTININAFDDYSNKSVQYWLGAIVADGCLTKRVLVFETIDKAWVEKLKDFLNPNLKVNSNNPKKGKTLYRFSVKCKGLDKKLLKYGITERKSLTISFKERITWDFFRGVFDGDGCITHCNNNNVRLQIVSGSSIFIGQLYTFLIQEGFHPTKTKSIKNRKNIQYSVNIFRQKELKLLYNLLYIEAGNNFLERKYQKFGSLLEKSNR